MEHRWGHRLSTSIPVRLRCQQALDCGCRCLGCMESVEPLVPALGLAQREIPASVVRAGNGEMAIEWIEPGSRSVSALLTETMLTSGAERSAHVRPFGRVPFCALAPVAAV